MIQRDHSYITHECVLRYMRLLITKHLKGVTRPFIANYCFPSAIERRNFYQNTQELLSLKNFIANIRRISRIERRGWFVYIKIYASAGVYRLCISVSRKASIDPDNWFRRTFIHRNTQILYSTLKDNQLPQESQQKTTVNQSVDVSRQNANDRDHNELFYYSESEDELEPESVVFYEEVKVV